MLQKVDGKQFKDYSGDRDLRYHVERALTIIGEACVRIRLAGNRDLLSNQGVMVRFRNLIIHSYDGIDDAIVCTMCICHLRPLFEEVNALLNE